MKLAYTSPQQTQVRGSPHMESWQLAMHIPRTLMTAQIDEVVDRYTLTYDSAVGSVPQFQEYTMYIGSTPGAPNLGIVRARRFIGADTIKINETALSTMPWQSGDYLTVLEDHRLWARHVEYNLLGDATVDGESVGERTREFIPQAVLGPPIVGYINEPVYFLSSEFSRTWAPDVGLVTADLLLPTGSWISTLGTGYISWTPTSLYENGRYVYLVVEDENGQTHTSSRLLWVFNRPGATSGRPRRNVQFNRIAGDIRTGGFETTVNVYDDTDWDTYQPIGGLTVPSVPGGFQCVVFQEDKGPTSPLPQPQHGGNYLYRENIKFWGWVLGETLRPAPQKSQRPSVELSMGGHHKILDQLHSYAVAMEDKSAPTIWSEMVRPTADKMLHYMCNYRSTYSYVDDFHPAGLYAADEAAKYYDIPPGTLWYQMKYIYAGDSFAPLALTGIGMQGGLYPDLDANILSLADRANYPKVADLTDADRRAALNIERRWTNAVAQVVLWGVDYDAPLGTHAPDDPVGSGAQVIEIPSLIAPDQNTINTWAGNILAKANSPYPEITIPTRGYVIDPFPQSYVTLTMVTANMGGRLTFSETVAWVRGFSLMPPQSGVCLAELTVELDIYGPPGTSITIPTIYFPITPPPPICTSNCFPPPPPTPSGEWQSLWRCTPTNLYAVLHPPAPPSTAQPTIHAANGGLTSFSAFVVYPWDTGYQLCHSGTSTIAGGCEAPILYRSHELDPGIPPWDRPWYVLVSAATVQLEIAKALVPSNPAQWPLVDIVSMSGLTMDINDPLRLYFVAAGKLGTNYTVYTVEVTFMKTSGSLVMQSVSPIHLHTANIFGGEGCMVAVGAFDASKVSEWSSPNRVIANGGNTGSRPAVWSTRVYTKESATEAAEWTNEVLEDPDGRTEIQLYGLLIDPNNQLVSYHWLPSDTNLPGTLPEIVIPAQFFRLDGRGGSGSYSRITNQDMLPSHSSLAHSTIGEPPYYFATSSICLWASWQATPHTIAQKIRYFTHYGNQYARINDANMSSVELVAPTGDIAINTPGDDIQCWGLAVLQADQEKIYAGKTWTGANKVGGITGNPDRDHVFCIAVDNGSGEIVFYDRSGDAGILRMTGTTIALAIDWEGKINYE